jgi:hypothetical protein
MGLFIWSQLDEYSCQDPDVSKVHNLAHSVALIWSCGDDTFQAAAYTKQTISLHGSNYLLMVGEGGVKARSHKQLFAAIFSFW